MTLTILTAAGPDIGYGHLVRMAALTRALEALDQSVAMVVEGDVEPSVFAALGVRDWELTPFTGSYRWAHTIVDVPDRMGYHAAQAHPLALVEPTGAIMVAGVRHEGFAYTLLRLEFAQYRRGPHPGTLDTIMVAFGGSAWVRDTIRPSVLALRESVSRHVRFVECPRTWTPAEAMSQADLAICPASMTALEFACLGVPTLTYTYSPETDAAQEAMIQASLTAPYDAELVEAFVRDPEFAGMFLRDVSLEQLRTVDGRGADRVASLIVSQL